MKMHSPKPAKARGKVSGMGVGQFKSRDKLSWALAACSLLATGSAHAAEHISLRNGFAVVVDHRTAEGGRTRLFMNAGNDDYVDVQTSEIAAIEVVDSPLMAAAPEPSKQASSTDRLSTPELHELLATAGAARDLDVDLLDCVVHAESGGHVRAVSRTGAQGLMQLMPGTAAELGVNDSFEPGQNITGGSAYLNALLLRYHDNLAMALAAYNAGPKAVDRYHGVPPYRETRAYVARIIHEFNQRKKAAESKARQSERAANQITTAHPGQSE